MTTDFDFAFTLHDAPPGIQPDAFEVVRFTGEESISAPYRYDLTLLARAPTPPIDPEELIGRRASLRIRTLSDPPCKHVHGLLVEAEELHAVPEGLLYRAALMPPFMRARCRTRCRIFLDKTLRQIIDTLLCDDLHLRRDDLATASSSEPDAGPDHAHEPPVERFAWRLRDRARVDDPASRPYCVQYNESDLDFLSRLLEAEGIAYHVEQSARAWILVLSDSDEGKARLDPRKPLGPSVPGRDLHDLRLGARLRPRGVRLRDYDWRRPSLPLAAPAGDTSSLLEERWPGGFAEAPALGEPLARATLGRLASEARYATAAGSCRLLAAGVVLTLDDDGERHGGEYLVTRMEARAEQEGVTSVSGGHAAPPWQARFELARRGLAGAPSDSRYAPPRRTPAPRITGSQTAFVTTEPSSAGAAIHVGGPPGAEIGCVRLRFHWDHDEERLAREPSSCWVRVSQVFAGAGEGALWHPRVGCEVIVEFLDGDPDRPIVTGRVYNGQHRPPAAAQGAATVSTLKSSSSPGGAVFNELCFDDTAGREQLRLHAGRDWACAVGHDREERIGAASASRVCADRSEATGGSRRTSVDGDNTESVHGAEEVSVDGARSVRVGGESALAVSGDRAVIVGGRLACAVGGDVSRCAGGSVGEEIGGCLSIATGADAAVHAGADLQLVAAATAALQGSMVAVSASGEIVLSAGGSAVKISGAGVEISGGTIKVAGASVDVTGGVVKIN